MADIIAIKDYFKKLQRAINEDADFTFFNIKLAKKNRIDDLLCCVLALLPDSYKKALKKRAVNVADQLTSVSAYNRLEKLIKKPFLLNSEIYVVQYNEALSLIRAITSNIERDINKLEGF